MQTFLNISMYHYVILFKYNYIKFRPKAYLNTLYATSNAVHYLLYVKLKLINDDKLELMLIR